MPSACSSRDPVKCGMVPLLGTPNVALSGLAFSQATNCWKSLTSAGTAVPTKIQNSNRTSWLTGTKSFAASKLGVVSTIGSRYIVGPVVTRMVAPSGLAPLTALMPIKPSPPERFSTMMLRSSKGPICCASKRHSASPPPPAANGKIILVSGPDCASAWPVHAASEHAALPARKSRRFILFLRTLLFVVSAQCRGGPASGQHRFDHGHNSDRDGGKAHRPLQAAIGPGERAGGDRKRHRDHRGQHAHADHRADAEQGDISQAYGRTGRLRNRQD